MLEEFSFEMDIVSELNKERKPIHMLKERYPDLYQLKANFYDRNWRGNISFSVAALYTFIY